MPRAPRDVTAVVLTHRRPGLAGDVVRSLVRLEGLPPSRVVLVVNGEGGLDDDEPRVTGEDRPIEPEHRAGGGFPGRPDRGVLGSDHRMGVLV